MTLPKTTEKMILDLYALYQAGKLKGPVQHEVNPGLKKDSRENYLYFTMAPALNFQRNSPALWRNALATYEDDATRYLFDPKQVVATPEEKLREDLSKHRLALQPNKHIQIWRAISATFAAHYDGDPRNFLGEQGHDVSRIIPALQKEKKHLFPYLGGLKMSNYWLFILSQFTDAQFKNMDQISIIPDTHITQSSVRLGLVSDGARPALVEATWRPILKTLDLSPTIMHSALWRWSRNGFTEA